MKKEGATRIILILIFISFQLADIGLLYATMNLLGERSSEQILVFLFSQLIAFFYTWVAYRLTMQNKKGQQKLSDDSVRKNGTLKCKVKDGFLKTLWIMLVWISYVIIIKFYGLDMLL